MTLECVVVMPVYNEAACIKHVLQDWHNNLTAQFETQFHIIIVNDGSTDNSAEIIQAFQKHYPNITLINQNHSGHAAAIRQGYNQAIAMHTDFIFQTDSDNQIPAEDFAKIWQKRRASRCILGLRNNRDDAPHRKIVSKILRLYIRALYGINIPDSNIPFRLYEHRFLIGLLKRIPETCFAPNIFMSIEAKKSGENLWHIPINHKKRTTGTASLNVSHLTRAGLQTMRELYAHKHRSHG